FVWIFSRQQLIYSFSVNSCFAFSCVMTRSHIVGTDFHCGAQEYIKFDFAIAKHIRIRRATTLIFSKHVIDNPLLVLLAEVDCLKRYAQVLGNNHGVIAVIQPWTFLADGYGVIMPVFHEHTDYLITLLE